jgi:hypothetical protein
MATPSYPVMAPAVIYEYLFYLLSSDRLRPPALQKAQGLLLGSSTLGTRDHQLRLKYLDTTDSHQ